jgi:hypothetical protein
LQRRPRLTQGCSAEEEEEFWSLLFVRNTKWKHITQIIPLLGLYSLVTKQRSWTQLMPKLVIWCDWESSIYLLCSELIFLKFIFILQDRNCETGEKYICSEAFMPAVYDELFSGDPSCHMRQLQKRHKQGTNDKQHEFRWPTDYFPCGPWWERASLTIWLCLPFPTQSRWFSHMWELKKLCKDHQHAT